MRKTVMRCCTLLTSVILAGCSGDALPTPPEAPAPGPGTVRVSLTFADNDAPEAPFGFRLDVAGAVNVLPNAGSVLRIVPSGHRSVTLVSPDPGCADIAHQTRVVEVAPADTVDVVFTVSCAARFGSLRVLVRTTGVDLGGGSYGLTMGSAATVSVAPNDTLVFERLLPGAHLLHRLSGVPDNCAPIDNFTGAPLTKLHFPISVFGGRQVDAAVTIRCFPSLSGMILVQVKRTGELWAARPDGSDPIRLNIPAMFTGGDVALSPGGGRLAWATDRAASVHPSEQGVPAGIRIHFLDGTFLTEGHRNQARVIRPKWSRDGAVIVAETRLGVILAMQADATEPRVIGNGQSPDLLTRDGPFLYLTSQLRVAPTLSVGGTPHGSSSNFQYPRWSPDGREIAHVCPQHLGGDYALCATVLGGATRRVAQGPRSVFFPEWSPDGSRLVYSSEGGVFVVAADGATPPLLLPMPLEAARPQWAP